LLEQLNKILEISDSEAGLKVEKSGGCFRRRRWMWRWWCRTTGQTETKFRFCQWRKKQGYLREHWPKCR